LYEQSCRRQRALRPGLGQTTKDKAKAQMAYTITVFLIASLPLYVPSSILTYPSAYLPTHLLNTDLSICCIIVDHIAYDGLVCEEVTCLVRR